MVGAAQPLRRFVEFASGRRQVLCAQQLADMGQLCLPDQGTHTGVDRVDPQRLLGQAGGLLEGARGQRDFNRLPQHQRVIGEL